MNNITQIKRGSTASWSLGPEMVQWENLDVWGKDSLIHCEGTDLQLNVYTASANYFYDEDGRLEDFKRPGLWLIQPGEINWDASAQVEFKCQTRGPSDCWLEVAAPNALSVHGQKIPLGQRAQMTVPYIGDWGLYIRWPDQREVIGTADIKISIRQVDAYEELAPGQLGVEYTEDGQVKLKAGMPNVFKWSELPYIGGDTKVLVVTAEWDEENKYYKTSHTPKQIYDHVQSGGIAVLKTGEGDFYNLYYTSEEYSSFFHVGEGLALCLCEINDAYVCSFYNQGLASQQSVSDLMQVITVDKNNVPSMTSQEIYNLVQNGGRVVLNYNNGIYNLASCHENSVYFNHYDDVYAMSCIEITGNNVYRYDDYFPASENWVLGQLGPISEALDAIIAIQKELIGEITFTIGGIEYQALRGMTWADWCDSAYNTDGYYYDDDSVHANNGDGVGYEGVIATPNDLIVDGRAYDGDM